MTALTRPFAAPCGPAGVARHTIDRARTRILVTGAAFLLAFLAIAARLGDLALVDRDVSAHIDRGTPGETYPGARADITDRNGVLLATSLATASLFGDARLVPDPDEAARKLATVLPDIDRQEIAQRLASGRGFVWIKRNLTPRQEYAVNALGIPGLDFKREDRRVYPMGPLAAHVLGFTDLDGHGIAGIEMALDKQVRKRGEPAALSIDVRVQNVLTEALQQAMDEFTAIGAMGLVMDVRTGEILAMTSLPGFDPNRLNEAKKESLFNRATLGVYEMGSTFKIFTAAMALDYGTATLAKSYDATKPIHIARFTINDYHAEHRWLTVPEIFEVSSNIGAARMAIEVGPERQHDFLARLGLLKPSPIELPENGAPLVPNPWRDINTMTIGFGHGISVTPVQLATAAAATVNGGILVPPTILKHAPGETIIAHRVVSERTSQEMRKLFRLVVSGGTGKNADAKGYMVGGKTGTAEKAEGHHYARHALLSSFLGVFPINAPRYLVLAMLDEPHGNKKSHGFATGGWVAAPAVRQVVERIAPMLGVMPVEDAPEIDRSLKIETVEKAAGGRKVASN
jgi:cell division protein FtsI (penicillin-binding protein 3)